MKHAEAIKTFICTDLVPDIDADELGDDYDLLANGVVDSLALVRLVSWTGETYGVPINDIDIAPEDISTVARIDAFIEGHSHQPA